MSYEKTIRALSGHFEGMAMSYEKTIRALSLHFEGTTKSYEKTIRALSLHFEGTAKSYEKTIRELSMHFEDNMAAMGCLGECSPVCFERFIYEAHIDMAFTLRHCRGYMPRKMHEAVWVEATYRDPPPRWRDDPKSGSHPKKYRMDWEIWCRRYCWGGTSRVHEASHADLLGVRKRSFRLAQFLVPFFDSITKQVIPDDLLTVHSEIVRAGETGSDADVSEDMHSNESANGVQEGSNDMSSEYDPFLAPTYESEDNADDIEVNEQGGIASGRPQVKPEICNGNSSSPVDNIITLVHAECDMQDMREVLLSISLVGLLKASCHQSPVKPFRQKSVSCLILFLAWFLARKIGHILTRSFFKIFEPLKDAVGTLLTVREGNALSFNVVPLLGLLTMTEESRFIMRKGFAQAVSIVIGSTALTTTAAPLSQPNVLVKKRSETIEQAAPISVDEVACSTGCHPQSPPPIVTNMENTGDCGMDVGLVKKKPYMDKQRKIQAIKAGLPNKTCLRRRPEHSSLDVTPGAMLPLVSTQCDLWDHVNPVPDLGGRSDTRLQG
ncbi:hypothetical protein IFM89_011118, partial [Coptis chinensis]